VVPRSMPRILLMMLGLGKGWNEEVDLTVYLGRHHAKKVQ